MAGNIQKTGIILKCSSQRSWFLIWVMRLRLFTVCIVFFILGCKDQKESDKPHSGLQDRLLVEIYAKVPKNDTFEVYYREEEELFTPENKEAVIVSGSDQIQKLVFTMEQRIFPTHIRLDFGNNPQQGEIYLEKLIFRYNKAEVVFGAPEIQTYFRTNKYLNFDFNTMTGAPKAINNKYDPYLDSNNISKFVNKLILY